MRSYFEFRSLITADLLRILYVIVAVILTLAAVPLGGYIGSESSPAIGLMAGAAFVLVANLLWRVYCELMIVIFSIHERLAEIGKSSRMAAAVLEASIESGIS